MSFPSHSAQDTSTGHTPYSVLVNSSDGYEDCWQPFFRLFTRHWPGCRAPILLNTQIKDWSYPGGPVKCTRVETVRGRPLSWSECLLEALSQVVTPLVLYFHEDYFIESPVDVATIEQLAGVMLADAQIRHIGLTHFGAAGPFEPTTDARLWRISRASRYRVSTQVGLWRVDALRSYLRAEENAWMFEIFGTLRARRRNECFLTVNREYFGPGKRVVEYLHTGIVKGRWHPGAPAVFEKFQIDLNFQKRGFYSEPGWLGRKVETAGRLLANPRVALAALVSW